MDFGQRRLLRHRRIYRTINLPFGIARLWESVETVSIVYNEAREEVVIRPALGRQKTINTMPITTPADHFGA